VKLLLDTHIWIWSQLEPEKIKPAVAEAIRDPGNEVWLSPISVWELQILTEKGRVILDRAADVWARETLQDAPANEAPLTHEIALLSRKVDLAHEDPADRFLVATAQVLDLVLVTADGQLLKTKSCRTLANR